MQLALTYDAASDGGSVWLAELSWLRKAVDALGHKHVAAELDIAPSHLTDALLERERKAMKGEWVRKIVHLSSDGLRAEWLDIVSRPIGYESSRIETLTPEEELRLIKEHLRSEAPGALRTFDQRLGRGHVVANGVAR